MKYEPHELSLAWPDMPADQFAALVDDVRANGLLHPIMIFEGRILDGRHRYKACLAANIDPIFLQFSGKDPVAYVSSENRHRRHLSPAQLAHSIAAMKPFEERKARERMAAGGGDQKSGSAVRRTPIADTGRTAEILAKKGGVSTRSVERAIVVREKGTPELNAAVAAGDIGLETAEKIARLEPKSQKVALAAPKAKRAAAISKSIHRSVSAKERHKRKSAPTPITQEQATSFVRKFLSGIERVAMVCAEDGVEDANAIASKFLREMDWRAEALMFQFERCLPVIRAMNVIQQSRASKVA